MSISKKWIACKTIISTLFWIVYPLAFILRIKEKYQNKENEYSIFFYGFAIVVALAYLSIQLLFKLKQKNKNSN